MNGEVGRIVVLTHLR